MPKQRTNEPRPAYKSFADFAVAEPGGEASLTEIRRIEAALALDPPDARIVIEIYGQIRSLRPQYKAWRHNAAVAPSAAEQREELARVTRDAEALLRSLQSMDALVLDRLSRALARDPVSEFEFPDFQRKLADADKGWLGSRRAERLKNDLARLLAACPHARDSLPPPKRNAHGRAAAPFRNCARELGITFAEKTGRQVNLKDTAGGFVALLRVAADIWDAKTSRDQLREAARFTQSHVNALMSLGGSVPPRTDT